jgi:L-amino acid N-acyltransferase YncA
MNHDTIIRLATPSDSAALLAIYAPYIQNTVITFEYEVPTTAEFSRRIAHVLKKYPWLVCEIKGRIVGYAYASPFNERSAYDWSVDASVYIHPDYHRKKIGVALYRCLFELLKLQGFYNVYAIITGANKGSLDFHQSLGFKPAGSYHNVGYKFNQWQDVTWLTLAIADYQKPPQKPRNIDEIKETPEFNAAVSKAMAQMKCLK